MTRTPCAVLGALALFAVAAPASAQVTMSGKDGGTLPTVLEGFTVDVGNGKRFPNVQLRFDTGERVTSDQEGRYTITGVPAGRHQVALVTGRCKVTFAEVELQPSEIKQVAFSVPSEMVGLGPTPEELKKRSEGEYYTAAELDEMKARNLLEVLRRVAPDMVGPEGGRPGSGAQLMGRTRTAQGLSVPIVVFDGVPVSDGVRAMRDFKPTDVASLEVLRGASRGWAYGTGGTGGVIKVTTRQGTPGYGLAHPDRCVIGEWPNGA